MKASSHSDEAAADLPQSSSDAPTHLPGVTNSFAERIRLLIQRVGSATEIARMCGFSEGVVRSWRDGNSDPSRARCVTLAKTLGISLVWLVAGEGTIHTDSVSPSEETPKAEVKRSSREGASSTLSVSGQPSYLQMVDGKRLEVAKRILQSGLQLSGNALPPSDHADMLVALYEIVGPGGTQIDTDALLAFNQRLAAQLHTEPGRLLS